MKAPTKEDFEIDAMEAVTEALRSGGSYNMKYDDHPLEDILTGKKMKISLANMMECAEWFLEPSDVIELRRLINEVVCAPMNVNKAVDLQTLFVDSIAAEIASREWLHYDHELAMEEL